MHIRLSGHVYISDHSFVHLELRINKPEAVKRTIRTRRMRDVEEK